MIRGVRAVLRLPAYNLGARGRSRKTARQHVVDPAHRVPTGIGETRFVRMDSRPAVEEVSRLTFDLSPPGKKTDRRGVRLGVEVAHENCQGASRLVQDEPADFNGVALAGTFAEGEMTIEDVDLSSLERQYNAEADALVAVVTFALKPSQLPAHDPLRHSAAENGEPFVDPENRHVDLTGRPRRMVARQLGNLLPLAASPREPPVMPGFLQGNDVGSVFGDQSSDDFLPSLPAAMIVPDVECHTLHGEQPLAKEGVVMPDTISEANFLLTELRYTLGQLHVQVLDLDASAREGGDDAGKSIDDILADMVSHEKEYQARYTELLGTELPEQNDDEIPLPINEAEAQPGREHTFEQKRAQTIALLERVGENWPEELLELVKQQVQQDRQCTTAIAERRMSVFSREQRPDLNEPLTSSSPER